MDPNDKFGAAGFGAAAYIAAGTLIPYHINFENLGPGSVPPPSQPATAPAQRVEITDVLSPLLDWSTLEFTEAGFGDTILSIPPGRQYYSATVSVTFNDVDFDVQVELRFDPNTGEVRAVFQSIDPETSLPPDVLSGFLPPEDGTGRGKGFLGFVIRPKSGLPTGTELRNVALISFDGQTIIATNQIDPQDPGQGTSPDREALNTIDADAPISSVADLPTFSASSFLVTWGGTDAGSGIGSFDVYVAIDTEPFQIWLNDTTESSATYTGEVGRTYRFLSRAQDNVGLAESLRPTADTVTQVVLFNEPPTVASTPVLTTLSENASTSSRIKVANVVVTDDALGTNVLSLAGADAGMFELDGFEVFLRAGTRRDFETNPVLDVTVAVDDADVGGSPDAFTSLSIHLTDVLEAATVLGGFSGKRTYKENAAPIVIAPSVTVTDRDTTNYVFGVLTVRITENGEIGDRLAVRHQGIRAGQIGVSGSNVTFGGAGNVIGTLSGGDGLSPLVVNLTAACTQAALKALIQNLTYADVADVPLTAAKRVELSVRGGDGMLSDVAFKTITVTPTNDTPTLGGFDGTTSFVESAGPVLVDFDATVADPDSANFDTGKLTIKIGANGHANDRLSLRHQGTGIGQVGVQTVGTTTNITYGGVPVGTLAGGMGTKPLVVTFKATATVAAVQAVLRCVQFSNVSANPTTLPRTLLATLTDGDGGKSLTASKSVSLQAVNTPPTIVVGAGLNYARGGGDTLVAGTGTVVDPDSANFNGGRLIIQITANSEATDRLRIVNQGTGPGKIGLHGSNVTFGGAVIGTWTGGDGGTPLVITFTSNAVTAAVAQALLRDITFGTATTTPANLPRTISVVLDDGDGATSAPATKTIHIIHNTTLGGWNGTTAYTENAAPMVIDSAVTLSDADTTSFGGFVLTLSVAANGTADDRLAIRHQGNGTNQIGFDGSNVQFQGTIIGAASGGTGTTPLSILLHAGTTKTALQMLIQNLTFANVSDAPSTLPRTLQLVVADAAGYDNAAVSKTVTVTAVNDAPALGAFGGSVNYTSGGPAVLIDDDATVTDVDRLDFATGKLTVQLTNNTQSTDRVRIRHQGTGAGEIGVNGDVVTYGGVAIGTFTGGSGTMALVITLNAAANGDAVQALLRSLEFTSTSFTPSLLPRTIRAALTDGDGGTATSSKSIQVAPSP